jgi:hypothetical protein
MRKSYHLTESDLTQIIKAHFAAKNEEVKSVEFKVQQGSDRHWPGESPYSTFIEAIVHIIEETK